MCYAPRLMINHAVRTSRGPPKRLFRRGFSIDHTDPANCSVGCPMRTADNVKEILDAMEENPDISREERKGHKGPSGVMDVLGDDVLDHVLFDPMHQV